MSNSNEAAMTVAAIGDLHVTENSAAPYRELFLEISSQRGTRLRSLG